MIVRAIHNEQFNITFKINHSAKDGRLWISVETSKHGVISEEDVSFNPNDYDEAVRYYEDRVEELQEEFAALLP